MILRRADLDAIVNLPTVSDRLKTSSSPIGGGYGMVRSGGTKLHNGWDLYSQVGTACYSVTPGEIVSTTPITGYGRSVIVKLYGPQADAVAKRHSVLAIYALYAHLSSVLVGRMSILEGARIALTGADGNAANTPPHLHFTLLKSPYPRKGVNDSIDPSELFGSQYYASRADDTARVKAIYSLK